MGNYILLGFQLLALVLCSIGFCTCDKIPLAILDGVFVLINIVGVCVDIHNIINQSINKYDTQHYVSDHIKLINEIENHIAQYHTEQEKENDAE